MEEKPYIHGYDEVEQKRLVSQAKTLEGKIFEKIDYQHPELILEVGCGVGAQTELLLTRYPNAKVIGIDVSPTQLNTARNYLKDKGYGLDRVELFEMSALNLLFEENTFDGVYICWVLEHLEDSVKVLQECRRVMKNSGIMYINEVQNTNLHLEPKSDFLDEYWSTYNQYQIDVQGDPYVGVKLGYYLDKAGFEHFDVYPQTFFYDINKREKREVMVNYWTELMLSGLPTLIESGIYHEKDKEVLIGEMEKVKNQDDGVFYYSFIQAKVIK